MDGVPRQRLLQGEKRNRNNESRGQMSCQISVPARLLAESGTIARISMKVPSFVLPRGKRDVPFYGPLSLVISVLPGVPCVWLVHAKYRDFSPRTNGILSYFRWSNCACRSCLYIVELIVSNLESLRVAKLVDILRANGRSILEKSFQCFDFKY